MPNPAQPETDQHRADQPEPPPPDVKAGDPTVDPKKGLADQGVDAYGTFAEEKTESSH